MAESDLRLRLATLDDAAMLHAWRNDRHTREASRTTDPIPFEQHRAWLEACLADPNRTLWIAESASGPVGTVRFDQGDQAELSWTVAPTARGQGWGTRMVALALNEVSGTVRAVARGNNVGSCKIAMANGFQVIDDDGEWVTFERIVGEEKTP